MMSGHLIDIILVPLLEALIIPSHFPSWGIFQEGYFWSNRSIEKRSHDRDVNLIFCSKSKIFLSISKIKINSNFLFYLYEAIALLGAIYSFRLYKMVTDQLSKIAINLQSSRGTTERESNEIIFQNEMQHNYTDLEKKQSKYLPISHFILFHIFFLYTALYEDSWYFSYLIYGSIKTPKE